MADTVSKSWFAVFNNPHVHGYSGEPEDVLQVLLDQWIKDHPTRTCAMTFCLSADGLPHVHMVLEDVKAMRFSAVKKAFPSAHLEPTKGSKDQAEDYIQKRGKFAEKGEKILASRKHGDIKGAQGSRRDLEVLEELIEQGYTPNEIMSMCFSYRRYETLIRKAYFDKRDKDTPFIRPMTVVWHVGAPGSGKTYTAAQIVEKHGRDHLYMITDYEKGGLDYYNGERFLFLDEFRGQIPYSTLLCMLHGYKQQFHARYTNIIGLWTEVHISSVLTPDMVYRKMVESSDRGDDPMGQLFRRINTIIYHWKDGDEYKQFVLPFDQYTDYETLKQRACGDESGFMSITEEERLALPF